MNYKIPFNKPFYSGQEIIYMQKCIRNGRISGNQYYTKRVHEYFKKRYGFKKCLFTTSCTDALEMCALLTNIEVGDEVILPSYTFVSTANSFVLRGAKLVFGDSYPNHPNMDPINIEELITERTKAIVVVHYAGVACDMDRFVEICKKYNLYLIEDAAQAIESYYKGRPLGTIGDLGTFSFHETKNITCGEGGLLGVNNELFIERAEIIWEKGTNRAAFFRGEIDKYGWVDIGSSYLGSDLLAAYLYAQLENIQRIQERRLKNWRLYYRLFKYGAEKGYYELPYIPQYATNNAHMFYLICRSGQERQSLIEHLRRHNIHAVFHYLALHKSPYYRDKHDGRDLPNADRFTECLIRMPLYYELKEHQIEYIYEKVAEFYGI